jgi:hypothetical protein
MTSVALPVMPSVSVNSVVTEYTRDNVGVIHICTLLDALFGENGWMGQDPDLVNKAVVDWLNNHREVFYYAWEGESFLRLAELDKGVRKTLESGKSVLLIEALS